MLLDPTPRATGGMFWEFKWCQGSVVLFLCLKHHCQPDSGDPHREIHALSKVYWPRYFLPPHYLLHSPSFPALFPSPKQIPAITVFLSFPVWAISSSLQGCVCGSSVLSSLLVSPFIPGCHLLMFQCGGLLVMGLCWAGISLLNYNWLTCWDLWRRDQDAFSQPFLWYNSPILFLELWIDQCSSNVVHESSYNDPA